MNIRSGLTACAIYLAVCAGAFASARTEQTPGEFVDDSVITAKLKTALVADPMTKARQIEVNTFRGDVQLSGFVDTAQSKSRAEQLARNIQGVTNVSNDLEVRPTDTSLKVTVDDSIVTTKVKAALIGDSQVKERQIKVDTLRGVVQLSGFVDSMAERHEATKVAAAVAGVRDVHNDLLIKMN
jgi:hyperosmotically inducible protein